MSEVNTKVEELYDAKAQLYHRMKEMIEVDHTTWSPEDEQAWNRMDSEMDELTASIEQEEAAVARRARMDAIDAQEERQKHVDKSERAEMAALRDGRLPGMTEDRTRQEAFIAWMRPSVATREGLFACKQVNLPVHQQEINIRMFNPLSGTATLQCPEGGSFEKRLRQTVEARAQATAPGSAGGYLVPTGMQMSLEIALLQFNSARRYADVVRAGDGRAVSWPTTDDSSNKGTIVGENAATTQLDVSFGNIETKPYLYSSKYVPVSIQLMQDAAESIPSILGRLLGERLGRIQEDHFATGTGASQPQGLLTGAADSTVDLNADNAPTWTDMMDLKHSVDPAYRMSGHGWVMSDTVLKGVKLIVDSQGRPLWHINLSSGEPATIDGDPYFINQSFPTSGTDGTKVIAYGQLNKYKIHDALDMQLRRLTELHALNHQETFISFMRSDGVLVDAGTNPVKYATNP